MIHFITVHWQSDQWIDIQLRNIRKHTQADHMIWASLDGVDQSHASKFDRAFQLDGTHGEKLNKIAAEIATQVPPTDLLAFIDGDAFPIDDFVPRTSFLLERYPLVAVQRSENLGDPQPHPCFTITPVSFWQEIDGDWTSGGRLSRGEKPPYTWITTTGRERADVGAQILGKLEDRGIAWYPLRRTNRHNLHPVMFGVYGNLVYHHGAGFRDKRILADTTQSGVYRWRSGIMGRLAAERLKWQWRRNDRMSEHVYNEIRKDDDFIKRFFLTAPAKREVLSPTPVNDAAN